VKVLVNAISAKRGGIVTYTENLIEALARRDVEAIFAVPPEIAHAHGESTLSSNASAYGAVRRFFWEQTAWRRLVRRIAPDVLFSSANFGLLVCPVPQLLLVREGGLFDPFYLVNSAPAQGALRAVERDFRRRLIVMSARRADRVMTPSLAMRDALLLWAPELASRCTVNPYGTLPAFYRPGSRARPWREDGVLRLLYVSVYYPHKNPAVICAALDRLQGEGLASHATITMDVEETAVPGGSHDRIVLAEAAHTGSATLGHRDYRSLPALYGAHDVFVFPSVSETFGHPMAEALAAGLPIVAADTAINREICGAAALYFHPFSPTDLVAALRRLDADPALRSRLAAEAVSRARALYDWDAHADRLVALLAEVAAHSKAAERSEAQP
jgi:glycosyltransferase involved in cell wall biosynthesis